MAEDQFSIYDPQFTSLFLKNHESIQKQFQMLMSVLREDFENQENLPKFHMIFEDDELSLEWCLKHKRLGFVLENDLGESSWFIVRKKPLYGDSGTFSDLDTFADVVKKVVLEFRGLGTDGDTSEKE